MFLIDVFGSKIAEARREMNLSQYELADRADITRKTLDAAERGTLMPDPAALLRLGTALETDIFVILQECGASDDEIAIFSGRTAKYSAKALATATDLCRLDPPPKKDEVESHDPV